MERDEIIKQCEGVVAACWGHYADAGLSAEEREHVLAALREALPGSVSSKNWEARRAVYDARVAEAEALTEEPGIYTENIEFGPGDLNVSR